MSRISLLMMALLLLSGLLNACNHDTDQISTESPSTRNSTADNPDSTSLVTDSSQVGR